MQITGILGFILLDNLISSSPPTSGRDRSKRPTWYDSSSWIASAAALPSSYNATKYLLFSRRSFLDNPVSSSSSTIRIIDFIYSHLNNLSFLPHINHFSPADHLFDSTRLVYMTTEMYVLLELLQGFLDPFASGKHS